MVSCPYCSAEQTETSAFCSACGAALQPEFAATVTHGTGASPTVSSVHSSPSDSSHHGRFLPGTKVADRYRIVSLVGKGGMGEVYRADDLKLGHAVALKFLPKELADDPQRLEYFHSEVRLTRQISHPNVCRVYDIGEVDGQHFLSMEHIDGEDLKILLRRIGRLPKDKGVQIAQQLCAGLAAAHDRGVLHRDLKPANVMIDGRGQVRITDFGLAKLAADDAECEVAGTPTYMSPEQLARGESTIQSDLYSLGLIFYELFTGEAVHKTGSINELMRAHAESSPTRPSSLVEDMDATVERVILRCLEKASQERPTSAQAVAAALPGGDPLAAALAAGETPSPEMVAAAGETGGLSLKVGFSLLSVICALLIAMPILASRLNTRQLSLLEENDPAVLRNDAVQWIRNKERLGHTHKANDSVYGFGVEDFRYRQSSRPLQPKIAKLFGSAGTWELTDDNPSVLEPGMISVRLDPQKQFGSGEQLLEFLAVLESDDSGEKAGTTTPDKEWDRHFEAVFLDRGMFIRTPDAERPQDWQPPIFTEDVSVWHSSDVQVVMAERNNKLVYFRRIFAPGETSGFRIIPKTIGSASLLTVLAVLFSGVLAFRNLKLGRADTRGGLRLAVYYFAVEIVLGVIASHHVADLESENLLAANYLIYALARSLRVWLYYVGFEPYVRQLWPDVLITWSRVLAGRFRDPQVGCDLMIGCIFAISFALATQFIDGGPIAPAKLNLGGSFVLTTTLIAHQAGILFSLYDIAVLLLCRILVRNTSLAVALFTVAMTLSITLKFDFNYEDLGGWILRSIWSAGIAILYIRFGLMAVIAGQCCHYLLVIVPHTADFGAWYAVPGNFALATVLLVACYGFYTSTLAGLA